MSLCQTSSFESNFSLCLRLLAHHTNWMGSHKIPVMQVLKNIFDRLHHCNHRDVLSSIFSGLTKFQNWAKGISIFLLINKVFKTSNWKQLLLWPIAMRIFISTKIDKGKTKCSKLQMGSSFFYGQWPKIFAQRQ